MTYILVSVLLDNFNEILAFSLYRIYSVTVVVTVFQGSAFMVVWSKLDGTWSFRVEGGADAKFTCPLMIFI